MSNYTLNLGGQLEHVFGRHGNRKSRITVHLVFVERRALRTRLRLRIVEVEVSTLGLQRIPS